MIVNKKRPRVGGFEPRASIDLQPRDLAILKAHAYHPYLTREYIAAALGVPDSNALLKRIFKLTQDLVPGATSPLLYRPLFQKNAQYLYRKTITALTPLGREMVAARDISPRGEHDLHKFMRSMIGASMEIAVKAHGWEWFTVDDMLDHPVCPKETRESPTPLLFRLSGGHTLTPDDIYKWDTGSQFRTCFVEIDRGTEDIRDYGKGTSTIEVKLRGYDEIIERKLHTVILGTKPLPSILFYTTTPGRAASMVEMVRQHSRYPDRYVFKHKPHFVTNGWEIPPVMPDLFTDPYMSVNGPVFLNK
jgi:hypothetical protein